MENELNDLPPVDEVEEIPSPEPVEETPLEAAEAPPVIDEPPDPAALEERIAELEAKRTKLEEDALYWREQKAAERESFFKEKQGIKAPPPPPAPEPNKPDPNDFEDYNQYVEALTDFKVDAKRVEWEQANTQREQNQEIQQKEATLHTKIQRGFEKYDDFEDVALAQAVPITPTIKDILAESENPEDIAYYLGSNRTEAIRISRMTPYTAAKAIAKIELELATPGQPPPKPISKAPAPITPIGASNKVSKNLENMTQKEFEAHRISQGAKQF